MGERYHAYLRAVYRKVRMEHPELDQGAVLALSTAGMNQTARPGGLIPTLLVFGMIPRMPVAPLQLPSQRDRVLAVLTARKEMQEQVARARVRTALTSPVPAAADRDFPPGAKVLVYREPPANKWVGPYTVVSQQDKTMWLAIDGQPKKFSVDKVKLYRTPAAPSAAASTAAPPRRTPSAPAPPAGTTREGGSPAGTPAGTEPPPEAPPRSTADPPPPAADDAATWMPGAEAAEPPDDASDHGGLLDAVIAGDQFLCRVRAACEEVLQGTPDMGGPDADVPTATYLTTAIRPNDPQVATARFQAAARKEVDGLRDRGTFRVVPMRDVNKGANVIQGRFVYTIKNAGTTEEQPKARFVAQGHNDKAKPFVVHNLATLRQRSTRLLVSTSEVLDFRLFAHDITQAYLQSRQAFTRQVYLRPRAADRHLFDVAADELLLLLLPLYGICDAGDYWHDTYTSHVKEDMGMRSLISDPALFSKRNLARELIGLLGAYVDDSLMGGMREFQKLTELTLQRFQAKPRVLDNADFVGVRVSTVTSPRPRFTLSQVTYVDQLQALPMDSRFKKFSSVRASIAWLAHTRPDLCCGINQLAQVSEAAFDATAIKSLNALISRAKALHELSLSYPKLDKTTLQLRAYADASFATNRDHSSQVGYIILLCDGTGCAHILSFGSRKSRRVVRSAMAGEVYAFTAALDEAFTIRYDLEQLYGQLIPLALYTDSKQLFDVVTRASHPTEKRLMIDVAAAREA